MSSFTKRSDPLRGIALAVVAAAAFSALPVHAEASKPKELRVCQDPDNMPFSNEQAEGFENRIADLFAQSMGVPVKYFNYPQRLNF